MRALRLRSLGALARGSRSRRRRSAAQTLDIYFIDVEGGQSTLVVTPAGESLLVDTGFPGTAVRACRRLRRRAIQSPRRATPASRRSTTC